jgi:hypothetical protein
MSRRAVERSCGASNVSLGCPRRGWRRGYRPREGAFVVVGLASGARESGEAGSLRVTSVRVTDVSYLDGALSRQVGKLSALFRSLFVVTSSPEHSIHSYTIAGSGSGGAGAHAPRTRRSRTAFASVCRRVSPPSQPPAPHISRNKTLHRRLRRIYRRRIFRRRLR